MSTTPARAPKGEVVRNPTRGGFTFALRFTAYNKRRYITLGPPEDGWTEAKARTELENILADVRRGIWQPHTIEAPPEPPQDPGFHEFASAWFEAIRDELRPNTVLDYEWQLRVHLLPFFKNHRLAQITVSEVDRYREAKVAEARAVEAAARRGKPIIDEYVDKRGFRRRRPRRPLSAVCINKTITRLGQILEVAVERELIPRNAAKVGGKRRRLKAPKPARVYLDRAEQIRALLNAAGELDGEARSNGTIARRALLATLAFAGLRISELLDLEWRDVDLAAGRLRVRHSKTDAGSRYVDLLPVLRDELSAHKAADTDATADSYVFPSAAGTRQDGGGVRVRVLARAIQRANQQLTADRQTPLPEGLTPHALRRTFASVLVALGHDPRYVMDQLGHSDPTVTLGIYAQVMRTSDADRQRLHVLVAGEQLDDVDEHVGAGVPQRNYLLDGCSGGTI
jgi:integrase